MLVALNYADVVSFLTDPDHDLTTVRKFKHCLNRVRHPTSRAAIEDVLRPADGAGEYVILLGMRIYKTRSALKFPMHAWGHLFAFRVCPGCVRALCRTVEEVIECSQYALFTGNASFGDAAHPVPDLDVGFMELLSVCGMVLDFPNRGQRVTVTKRLNADKTTVWEEQKNNPVLCAALSPTDPKARLPQHASSALSFHADARRHAAQEEMRTGPSIQRGVQFISRLKRTSATLAGLRKKPWTSRFVFGANLLDRPLAHDACPESCLDRIDFDAMRLAVSLLFLWEEVHQAQDLLELCHMIAQPYITDNELELDPSAELDPEEPVFLPNCENGVVAYQASWGSTYRFGTGGRPTDTPWPTVWPLAALLSDTSKYSE
ncbi:hypothetical protein FB451DRAFT_1433605 [Mycena latifolia]|nr:hypothetical protein FB451DRAFT_1433605 [Mycena latifolia]